MKQLPLGLALLALAGPACALPEASAQEGSAPACVPPERASLEALDAAIARARIDSQRGLEAGLELERGNRWLAVGDAAPALTSFEASLALARGAGDAALAARAALSAGRARVEQLVLPWSAAELEAVLVEVGALPEARERAELRLHAAKTLLRRAERAAEERTALRHRAAELLSLAARDAEGGSAADARLRSFALGELASLYADLGRATEARALARRALFAAERGDAPEALSRWHALLGRIEAGAGDRDAALAAYRRAVASLAELRLSSALAGTEAAAAFRVEVEPIYLGLVDELLRRAETLAASVPAAREQEQALLREARTVFEDWKAAELRDYFRDPCLDAQRKAAPDEVPGALVVYPIALRDRLELVASRGGTLRRVRVPVGRDALESELRRFREGLEKRTTRQYLRPAAQLYEWLVRPLAEQLGDRETTLVFVPSGALRSVPFAALFDQRASQYLIEQHPVAVTPGLTLTEPRALERGGQQLLAAGLSASVQGFPALPQVPAELAAVAAGGASTTLLDADFATERFERELGARPYGIVHIASHGEFNADPERSFLLTFDGRVPLSRLSALIGATRFRDVQPLELLTLSACETAAGDERAALGLAGVALRSGARSALATLWSVHDQATTELVSEFYRQLEQPGVSRAKALQRAQQKLLAQPHFRHAGYWSPFVLISSWL